MQKFFKYTNITVMKKKSKKITCQKYVRQFYGQRVVSYVIGLVPVRVKSLTMVQGTNLIV